MLREQDGSPLPRTAEVRHGPVCCDRQAAENEDEPAGFAARELLDAKPTGSWHGLVALFRRYRTPINPRIWWVALGPVASPVNRGGCARPHETDLAGLDPIARDPNLRFRQRKPRIVACRTVSVQLMFATELSFSPRQLGSLGAVQAGALLTLCARRRGSGGGSECSRYRGFLVTSKVLWA